ncbi:MAG: hypothetical protein JKX70_08155 [Phycisphaerales bacterium]|nr:hypothetical protein [Phycisphaerales bacterium]
MNICTKLALSAAIGALSIAAPAAMAETVDLSFIGHTGLNTVTLNGGTSIYAGQSFSAGHLTHSIDSGPRAGQTYNTFCVELAERANSGSSTYEIVDLSEAPRSETPDDASDNYGVVKAALVVGVISKAVDLGWIDISLQRMAGSTVDQMSAIQAMIWAVLYDATASSGDAGVTAALSALTIQTASSSTFNIMESRLRAVVADGEQDQLYVVPLPPAVFAGLGMLGSLAGVRTIRRRR